MEALVIVVGLVVLPALVAAMVVALVASRRRAPAADPAVQRAERDDAITAAIEQMVRMNEQAIAAERRLGSQELEGKKSLIDREIVGMRGELEKLTSLVHDIEHERREHVGQLTTQLAEAGDGDFATVVEQSSLPVVVDLWAPWCGPCRMISPALEEVARSLRGRMKLVKVNVDDNPGTARRFAVQGIPTLLVFRDGQLVDRSVGAQGPAQLQAWVEPLLTDA